MVIDPCLVVATGISCTGKSTTLTELVTQIPQSFILEKDTINQANLHVLPTQDKRLPTFEDYVAMDNVFPDNARAVQTPLGEMIQVDPKNAFYGRHARDQTYILMAGVSRTNLGLGKIPILDCMTVKLLQDGTVQRFLDQQAFRGFQKYLIHFVADEEDSYQRHVQRASINPAAAIRDKDKITSRKAFHDFLTQQPISPKELKHYEHLLVNTSEGTPRDCAQKCLEYISHKGSQSLIVRVNNQGKFIDSIPYNQAHPQDKHQAGQRHLTSNVLIFEDDSHKRVLLQIRGNVVKSGVQDMSVGGHVDWLEGKMRSETPEETAYRETNEELFSGRGIPSELEIKKVAQFPKQTRPNDPEFVNLFTAVYPGPFNPSSNEVSALRFINTKELITDIRTHPEKYTKSLGIILKKYKGAT